MNVNELTIGQARELAEMFGAFSELKPECPFQKGSKYLIRTVTHIQTGCVKSIVGNFLVLEDAAWIADTGRFFDALSTGELNEVEPFPDICIVSLNAIIDASPWVHELPGEQK